MAVADQADGCGDRHTLHRARNYDPCKNTGGTSIPVGRSTLRSISYL